jgi:hypothetical protein
MGVDHSRRALHFRGTGEGYCHMSAQVTTSGNRWKSCSSARSNVARIDKGRARTGGPARARLVIRVQRQGGEQQ